MKLACRAVKTRGSQVIGIPSDLIIFLTQPHDEKCSSCTHSSLSYKQLPTFLFLQTPCIAPSSSFYEPTLLGEFWREMYSTFLPSLGDLSAHLS